MGDDREGGEGVLEKLVSIDRNKWVVRLMVGRKKFEVERLSAEDVEMEDLNFYYADYSRSV